TFNWVDHWGEAGSGLGWALETAAPGLYALSLQIQNPDGQLHHWKARLGAQQLDGQGAGMEVKLGGLRLTAGADTLWLYHRGPATAPSLRVMGLTLSRQ
ncbi:MAG: hypothetical protein D6722_14510, partial [Bacteroidetes bacterium]